MPCLSQAALPAAVPGYLPRLVAATASTTPPLVFASGQAVSDRCTAQELVIATTIWNLSTSITMVED